MKELRSASGGKRVLVSLAVGAPSVLLFIGWGFWTIGWPAPDMPTNVLIGAGIPFFLVLSLVIGDTLGLFLFGWTIEDL